MLQQFSKNIETQKVHQSSADLANFQFQKSLIDASNDLRLTEINLEDFEHPTAAIVYIILHGRGVQRQGLARHLSLEACLNRPSLMSLENSSFLSKGEIIKIIARLIDDLSKYFEVKASQSIEELTWFIYENYKQLSLEDLILFCQYCKERKFTTPYQHINAKGVNPEFLQVWLEKYAGQREERRREITNQFRSQPFAVDNHSKQFWTETATKFENTILERKKRESNLRDLGLAYKKQESEKSEMAKFQAFFAFEILRFQFEYHSKSDAQLLKIAHEKTADLVKNWESEFNSKIKEPPSKKLNETGQEELTTDGFQNVLTSDGAYKRIRIPAITLDKYVNSKKRQFIYQTDKKRAGIFPLDMLRNGLTQLIEKRNISVGHELISTLYSTPQNKTDESLFSAQNRVIIRTEKMMSNDFKKYEDGMVNDKSIYLSKEKYCRIWAWNWICQRCLSKIQNPKNIL